MKLPSQVHNFSESLSIGKKWEEQIHERLEDVLLRASLSSVDFNQQPQKQLRGIDKVFQESGDVCVDVKARSFSAYKYDDILIETVSVMERNELGWFYKDDIDVVAYVWETPSGNGLHDGYFLVMSDRLRDWFDSRKDQYPVRIAKSRDGNRTWRTKNRAVPIEDFPSSECINFDPDPTTSTAFDDVWGSGEQDQPQDTPYTTLSQF